MKYLKITEAAKILGVSQSTLRRWAEDGTLTPSYISNGGTRFYSLSDIEALKFVSDMKTEGTSIAYIRSLNEEDMADYRQTVTLCRPDISIIIEDRSDPLDTSSSALMSVLKSIEQNAISELVVMNKSQLTTPHFDLFYSICRIHNVKLTVLDKIQPSVKSLTLDLVSDLKEYNKQFGDDRLRDLINVLEGR